MDETPDKICIPNKTLHNSIRTARRNEWILQSMSNLLAANEVVGGGPANPLGGNPEYEHPIIQHQEQFKTREARPRHYRRARIFDDSAEPDDHAVVDDKEFIRLDPAMSIKAQLSVFDEAARVSEEFYAAHRDHMTLYRTTYFLSNLDPLRKMIQYDGFPDETWFEDGKVYQKMPQLKKSLWDGILFMFRTVRSSREILNDERRLAFLCRLEGLARVSAIVRLFGDAFPRRSHVLHDVVEKFDRKAFNAMTDVKETELKPELSVHEKLSVLDELARGSKEFCTDPGHQATWRRTLDLLEKFDPLLNMMQSDGFRKDESIPDDLKERLLEYLTMRIYENIDETISHLWRGIGDMCKVIELSRIFKDEDKRLSSLCSVGFLAKMAMMVRTFLDAFPRRPRLQQ